jgi:hypothetical protein
MAPFNNLLNPDCNYFQIEEEKDIIKIGHNPACILKIRERNISENI